MWKNNIKQHENNTNTKQDFVNNGFYDENMKLGYEDWELNLRLASNNVFGKRLPIPLFIMTFKILACFYQNQSLMFDLHNHP